MYGSFVLLEQSGKIARGERVHVGETKGRNEAWLRNMLFNFPEIVPTEDIDPTFSPLIPLCKELRTEAGLIDATFVNERGRLTIVECKLWKNPQSRREVVAQTLHYVSALSEWTYADLQRQVSAALGKKGNVPYEVVREHTRNGIKEAEFVDAVSRTLREGRVLVLIAGEGIREGVQALAELINRNATNAFSFGLVEIALYRFSNGRLTIQPRILAQTEILTRQVTVTNNKGAVFGSALSDNIEEDASGPTRRAIGGKGHLKEWWDPILRMRFDDPEQEPPRWLGTNNIALATPFLGIQIKAWAMVDGSHVGVYVTGSRAENVEAIRGYLRRDRRYLLDNLPKDTVIEPSHNWPIVLQDFEAQTDSDRHQWLKKALNSFVNVLRPRLKKWYDEVHSSGPA
jgi:hypothetical protein